MILVLRTRCLLAASAGDSERPVIFSNGLIDFFKVFLVVWHGFHFFERKEGDGRFIFFLFSVFKDKYLVPAWRLGLLKTLELILLHLVGGGIAHAFDFDLRLMLVDDVAGVVLARPILLDSWQSRDRRVLERALLLRFGRLCPASEEICVRRSGASKRTRYHFICLISLLLRVVCIGIVWHNFLNVQVFYLERTGLHLLLVYPHVVWQLCSSTIANFQRCISLIFEFAFMVLAR